MVFDVMDLPMPGAPFVAFLFLVAMPFAPSSYLLLVAMPLLLVASNSCQGAIAFEAVLLRTHLLLSWQ